MITKTFIMVNSLLNFVREHTDSQFPLVLSCEKKKSKTVNLLPLLHFLDQSVWFVFIIIL